MKRFSLDLSKGLDLSASDLAVPFRVTRLPLWPKPGLTWSSHPGHDTFATPVAFTQATRILHSDLSGLMVLSDGTELSILDIPSGRLKTGPYFDGAFLPKTGWYRSRFNKLFLDDRADLPPVLIRPLKVVAGNLDAGQYVIWALSFARLETGLLFQWYSKATAYISANGGLEIELSEEPGDDRLVRLYVQRSAQGGGLGPLVYLAELRGGDKTFAYTSHLQEGERVSFAIPKGRGQYAAYYNGRYFYQADELDVLGVTGTPLSGQPGQPAVDLSGGGVFALGSEGYALAPIAENAQFATIGAWANWDSFVDTQAGVFVAVRRGGRTEIYHASDGNLLGWSLVYTDPSGVGLTLAAASPSRVVFIGGGKAVVGLLDGNAFRSPSGWREVSLPVSSPVKDLIWTGQEFAAIVDRGLLRGGVDAANWTLVTPPASLDADFNEWRHLAFSQGRYFIYAARPIGGDSWNQRVFVYNGTTWASVNTLPALLGEFTCKGISYLYADEQRLVVGHGIYLLGVSVIARFTEYMPSSFPGGSTRTAEGTYLLEQVQTGTLLRPGYGIAAFVSGNKITAYDYRTSQVRRLEALFSPLRGVGVYSGNRLAINHVVGSIHIGSFPGLNAPFTLNVSNYFSRLGNLSSERPVYTSRDYYYIADRGLGVSAYRLPPGVNGENTLATHEGGRLILAHQTPTQTQVFVGPIGSPNPLGSVGFTEFPAILRGDEDTVLVAKQAFDTPARVAIYHNGSFVVHTLPSDLRAVVKDGTNWYAVCTGHVVRVEPNGLTTIATGSFTGGGDGSGGKIYVGYTNGEIRELDTATGTTTLVATQSHNFMYGILVGTTPVFRLGQDIYFLDGTNLRQVASLSGPSQLIGVASGGGGAPEDAGPDVSTIRLPANAVVWTEPGYINLTTPFNYHSFVWRASSQINEIAPSPNGVLVMADNEMYLMAGRFSSVQDTRIAPYPAPVGLDRGGKIGSMGGVFFVPWGGRLYMLDGGQAELISYQVEDGVPFVAVLYDAKHNMLVARKADGRVLRYDIVRKAWFDDMEDARDIAYYIDGIVYLREVEGSVLPYRLTEEGQQLSENYYRIPQEVWIDAALMELGTIKRLRAIYIMAKGDGPINAGCQVYNEAEVEVVGAQFVPTIGSNPFGLGRYQVRFPPVITLAPRRIRLTFSGFRFDLAPQIEVHYEERHRKV